MFRYPGNQRLEITLRHLRGEKAVDLSREFNIPERQIRRWKRIAVQAVEARLAGHRQLTNDSTPLYDFQRAFRRLHQDIKDWRPDFTKLDRTKWKIPNSETRGPRRGRPSPEADGPPLVP